MKKRIMILLISLVVFLMIGCKKDEPVSDFIPTQAPTPGADAIDDNVDVIDIDDEANDGDNQDNGEEDSVGTEDGSDDNQSEDDVPVYVGTSKPMYAKLNQYDSTLYVRSEPTTDSEIVGFLVHTEKIEVIKIENEWASFVFTDGKVRYVNSKFLVDYEPSKLVPPTPTIAPSVAPTRSTASSEPSA